MTSLLSVDSFVATAMSAVLPVDEFERCQPREGGGQLVVMTRNPLSDHETGTLGLTRPVDKLLLIAETELAKAEGAGGNILFRDGRDKLVDDVCGSGDPVDVVLLVGTLRRYAALSEMQLAQVKGANSNVFILDGRDELVDDVVRGRGRAVLVLFVRAQRRRLALRGSLGRQGDGLSGIAILCHVDRGAGRGLESVRAGRSCR